MTETLHFWLELKEKFDNLFLESTAISAYQRLMFCQNQWSDEAANEICVTRADRYFVRD